MKNTRPARHTTRTNSIQELGLAFGGDKQSHNAGHGVVALVALDVRSVVRRPCPPPSGRFPPPRRLLRPLLLLADAVVIVMVRRVSTVRHGIRVALVGVVLVAVEMMVHTPVDAEAGVDRPDQWRW